MANKFNSRVYGCTIIKSINSNYNADFSGQPRKLPNGVVYATDKALKYSIRNYWKEMYSEEKIFFFKSFNESLIPRSLDERYISFFSEFKRNVTSDKYCLFEFDGEYVKGVIPNQPKKKNVSDIYKDMEEDDDLKSIEKELLELTKKTTKTSSIDSISKDGLGEDECFFYIEKEGKNIKIDTDKSIIQRASSLILENMGGGINRILTLKDLLSCLDIKLFGATYAGQTNISIHGTCQITHGLNKYVESVIFSEQIMSPFRNPKEKSADSTMTTLGSQSRLQEGHYVHHFSVNPKNIEEDTARTGAEGLTTDDIAKLKEGLRKGATYYDSAAKAGTENELLLWIQLKEGSRLVLPTLVELVEVNEQKEINLKKVADLLAAEHIASDIEKIEIYYNKAVTKVINELKGSQFLEL